MDTCERVAQHDPESSSWSDKFFVECSTALMQPAVVRQVGQAAWLPGLLHCVVVRLNRDEPPMLPAREAIAALQILAAVARVPEARPAVRKAIFSLGDRADELFNDKLKGMRSFASVNAADGTSGGLSELMAMAVGGSKGGASGNDGAIGRSVVHNTLVVCLMRVEGYQLRADALLDLVDRDVAALMSILLAVAKVATFELGITANCLTLMEALTHPRTYFSPDGDDNSNDGASSAASGSAAGGSPTSQEKRFSDFTRKISTLIKIWSQANALDTVLPVIHRRAARWSRELPPSSVVDELNKSAKPEHSPVTPNAGQSSSVNEMEEDAVALATGMNALARTVSNLVHYSNDPAEATGLRQHILVVQASCSAYAATLSCLAVASSACGGGGTLTSQQRLKQTYSAVAASLELLALASRDVPRVPRVTQSAVLVTASTILDRAAADAGVLQKCVPSRLLVGIAVAFVNTGLMDCAADAEKDPADGVLAEMAEMVAGATKSLMAAVVSREGGVDAWLTIVSGHPNINHNRAADGLTALRSAVNVDIDAMIDDIDAENAKLEQDLREMRAENEAGTDGGVDAMRDAMSRAIDEAVSAMDDDMLRLEADLKEMQTARDASRNSAAAVPAAQAPTKAQPPAAAPSAAGAAASPDNRSGSKDSLLGALPALQRGAGGAAAAAGSPSRALAFVSMDDDHAIFSTSNANDDDGAGRRWPGSQSKSASPKQQQPSSSLPSVPAEFLCAVRGGVMLEPVRLPCGKHADKRNLADVIERVGHVDPVTAKPLPNDFDAGAVDAELKQRITQYRFTVAMAGGRML